MNIKVTIKGAKNRCSKITVNSERPKNAAKLALAAVLYVEQILSEGGDPKVIDEIIDGKQKIERG